jgi:uncharacterized protein (TIGR00106 family)
MLIEFRIVPVGRDAHTSGEIAEAIRVLDDAGLPYRLMPSATCVEGEWEEVMPVIQRCHARVREMSPHVITSITIEDDEDGGNKLERNVASVEEKLGHAAGRALDAQELIEPLEAPSGPPGPEFRRHREGEEDEDSSTLE